MIAPSTVILPSTAPSHGWRIWSVTPMPSEAETVLATLDGLTAGGRGLAPVGDFSSPLNPRRVQLVLEKVREQVNLSRQQSSQE